MSLGNAIRRLWHKFELFASAMDFDERTDIAARVGNLNLAQKSQEAALTAALARIDSLSGEVSTLSEHIRNSSDISG